MRIKSQVRPEPFDSHLTQHASNASQFEWWGEAIDSQLTHTRTRDGFPQIALALEVSETQYGLNMESNFIIHKTTGACNWEAE